MVFPSAVSFYSTFRTDAYEPLEERPRPSGYVINVARHLANLVRGSLRGVSREVEEEKEGEREISESRETLYLRVTDSIVSGECAAVTRDTHLPGSDHPLISAYSARHIAEPPARSGEIGRGRDELSIGAVKLERDAPSAPRTKIRFEPIADGQ